MPSYFFSVHRLRPKLLQSSQIGGDYVEDKILLSIKEASDLFGIGEHRLREIVRDDYESRYHLMIGRVIRIKRKSFEEFIQNVEQI